MNVQQLIQTVTQFQESTGEYPASVMLHYEDYMGLVKNADAKDYLELETSKEMLRNGICAYLKTPQTITILVSRVIQPGGTLCLSEAHYLGRLGFK